MISFENPLFVKISLKPKEVQTSKSNVQGKMVQVLENLKKGKLDYLLVIGNVSKIVPIWKIGSIINLTKEYSSKLKDETEILKIDNKTINYIKGLDASLVVSFKEENNIGIDLEKYMKGTLSKECMIISTSDINDLESMIKLYKSVFEVESVELLKINQII